MKSHRQRMILAALAAGTLTCSTACPPAAAGGPPPPPRADAPGSSRLSEAELSLIKGKAEDLAFESLDRKLPHLGKTVKLLYAGNFAIFGARDIQKITSAGDREAQKKAINDIVQDKVQESWQLFIQGIPAVVEWVLEKTPIPARKLGIEAAKLASGTKLLTDVVLGIFEANEISLSSEMTAEERQRAHAFLARLRQYEQLRAVDTLLHAKAPNATVQPDFLRRKSAPSFEGEWLDGDKRRVIRGGVGTYQVEMTPRHTWTFKGTESDISYHWAPSAAEIKRMWDGISEKAAQQAVGRVAIPVRLILNGDTIEMQQQQTRLDWSPTTGELLKVTLTQQFLTKTWKRSNP